MTITVYGQCSYRHKRLIVMCPPDPAIDLRDFTIDFLKAMETPEHKYKHRCGKCGTLVTFYMLERD